MLRTSIRSVRVLGHRPAASVVGRQWQAAAVRRRHFADDKKPVDPSKPAVLPASETITAEKAAAPEITAAAAAAESAIPKNEVPLAPPTPKTETVVPPPPPQTPAAAAPKKKGFFRRLRNLVLTLAVLGAVGFGGGVWYSRLNDSFHDFFTEYVPFGEQAVLYFEEMDFRKRFPTISNKIKPRDTGSQVKVPAQSGASWRVADSGEPAGRQSSAVDKAAAKVVAVKKEEKPVEKPKARETKVKAAPVEAKPVVAAKEETTEFKAPEVNEPSRFPPIPPIDAINIEDATEPVVQDLVRMLNDIITVINADKAHGRYSPTISKAKNELSKVGSKIKAIKSSVEEKAAAEVQAKVADFDKAANDLIARVEGAMVSQEAQWRKEFESEMQKVKESYDARTKLLLEREKQLNEERLNNQLLEQALALKKEFVAEVENHVESEREGRLGKLEKLSSAVADLEKLTTGWNEVVDTNLRTQQLHVAVDAVRASLENAAHPRPFTRELVALKEIAADDPVVNAAIASINPSAYQRGLSNAAQLIDRFRSVAGEVRKASLLPDDAGVASHASSYLLSKVMFKKQGLADGNDVESILTRTQTLLEEGNLDAAAREMNGLQGWAKTLSRDWLGEVRKVLEVQQALDVIATEARLQSLKDAVDALNTLQTPFAVIEARRKAGVRPDEASIKEMRAYLARIGYTTSDLDALNVIHVAGTKGKGSTCAFTDSILSHHAALSPSLQPAKIGLLISPHLIAVRERIRINGAPLSEALFARYFFEVWDRLGASTEMEDVVALGTRPIYSRYLTLVSYHAFVQEGVDCAILETGIGGEYDATNLVGRPVATGITTLGIDHVFALGDTVGKIAWHKAGIMKVGSPAFTVEQVPEARAVLEERAREKGVTLEVVGVDARLEGVRIRPDAVFQRRNASLAIRLAESVLRKLDPGFVVDEEKLPPAFVRGLEEVVWRGRCEVKDEGRIVWFVDGAHTTDSLRMAGRWFAGETRGRTGPRVLVFNQQGRSEAIDFLDGVYEAVEREGRGFESVVFCTNVTYKQTGYKRDFVNHQYDSKAIEAMTVQKQFAERWRELDPRADVRVIPTIEEALEHVRGLAGGVKEEDGESVQAFVTGSLHLVGGALQILEGADAL
ncbi:folylpolyglutamate synthase [Colletotrichum karsti]|uniref:MICOS complex subunit MIC60 n=1 Tax=Colletotrichum karsti TaxID=1095194 RepID=A0A9P6HUD0_9PEZI|nr:folylpolyglutamate synthase [Colletotrichum karsti]KAF9869962.1 folylpolyglutamate synthase [Colletotrichum karsti]